MQKTVNSADYSWWGGRRTWMSDIMWKVEPEEVLPWGESKLPSRIWAGNNQSRVSSFPDSMKYWSKFDLCVYFVFCGIRIAILPLLHLYHLVNTFVTMCLWVTWLSSSGLPTHFSICYYHICIHYSLYCHIMGPKEPKCMEKEEEDEPWKSSHPVLAAQINHSSHS